MVGTTGARPALLYEDFVEVRTTGSRRASLLMELGWTLLYIGNEAKVETEVKGMQPFVKRFVVFVVGRTEGVQLDVPSDLPPPEAEIEAEED